MQKWILVYTSQPPQQFTTYFEASDRDLAKNHVNIFFQILMGATLQPEVLRSKWLEETHTVFEGSAISDEFGGQNLIFKGLLFSAAEFKKLIESQPNDIDKKLLDRLKTHTDLPPI